MVKIRLKRYGRKKQESIENRIKKGAQLTKTVASLIKNIKDQ